MATSVIMPRQGQSVESCILTKWHMKKGDQVNVGDVLFTYETDKATFDEESKVAGILLDTFFDEDDDIPCLTNVCVIGQPGESTEEFNPKNSKAEGKAESEVKTEKKEENVQNIQAVQQAAIPAENIKISPRARALAEKLGADVRYAMPSGPDGRIIEQDILNLVQNGPKFTNAAKDEYMSSGVKIEGTGIGGRITTDDIAKSKMKVPEAAAHVTAVKQDISAEEPEYTTVKLTNIRKIIAKSMLNSLSTSAQLTLNTTFDATEVMDYRKKIKSNMDKLGLENITLNDIIVYALSRTILDHKELNANLVDDKILIFNNANIGVAVDTDRGLMVPTVFKANKKSLNEISKEIKVDAEDCKKGMISPDILKGASITVTNLGSQGIESFTPVINMPQVAILGVDAIVKRVKEIDGKIVCYPAMGLSLTFDHRAVDGSPAAKFLKDLKENLENFSMLLAK